MVGFRFKGLQKIIEYGTMNLTNKTRGEQSPKRSKKMLKLDRLEKRELILIMFEIAKRADDMDILAVDRLTLKMDLENVNKKIKMNFKELLKADESDFVHDIYNIQLFMDRETGELENDFVPRYAYQDLY